MRIDRWWWMMKMVFMFVYIVVIIIVNMIQIFVSAQEDTTTEDNYHDYGYCNKPSEHCTCCVLLPLTFAHPLVTARLHCLSVHYCQCRYYLLHHQSFLQLIQLIIESMQTSYHYELNPVCKTIIKCLDEITALPENIQLEIKQAQIKKNTDQQLYKQLQTSSMLHPLIISFNKYRSSIKVHARADPVLYANAEKALKHMRSHIKYQLKQSYQLYVNAEDEKYLYECDRKTWDRIDKSSLFHHNFDIMSLKKLYRVNMSEKTLLETDIGGKIRARLIKIKQKDGVIRFKHNFIHVLNQKYEIANSIVFETSNLEEYNKLINLLSDEPEELDEYIKKTLKRQSKMENTRLELQLRFRASRMGWVLKCSELSLKRQISQAFDLLVSLTREERSEQELIKMMKQLKIEEKQQQQQEYIVKPSK